MNPIRTRSTMIVELIDFMGSDKSVIAAARVSTQGQRSKETFTQEASEGLINFLIKNRHGTPFEHNSITFLVSAPIFVFREFHRHRIGFSYNEESGRYKQLEPVFYLPDNDRNLIQEGKPGHYTYIPGTPEQTIAVQDTLEKSYSESYQCYQTLLDDGIAKEVARACLPVAIFSSMYVTCNARSLMAFLSLRTKSELSTFPSFPQREIEMVAEKLEEYFGQLFPITHDAFNAHGRVAP